ncbi:MAG: hypothetical protein HZB76_02835 [Chlamydiae bacterium]|nr:hypothetical protein [Chlamydiota bacterium]
MKIDLDYALLAAQNALLDTITPQLRAVTVDLDIEKTIFYMNFYYDGEVSDELIELWDCAESEASADLGLFFVESEIVRLDYPNKIPVKGKLAYLRKE